MICWEILSVVLVLDVGRGGLLGWKKLGYLKESDLELWTVGEWVISWEYWKARR